MHFNSNFSVKLRDDDVRNVRWGEEEKREKREERVEPSVLIYQTDLCGALLDELDRRTIGVKETSLREKRTANENAGSNFFADVKAYFNSNITHVDLVTSRISIKQNSEQSTQQQQQE